VLETEREVLVGGGVCVYVCGGASMCVFLCESERDGEGGAQE